MSKNMELSRREVPLYGQVEVMAVFQDTVLEPEEAELYVFVEGSTLTHVTAAKRSEGPSLCFTVPGHDIPEVVSVTPCLYTEEGVKPCGGSASLQYVRDVAQEVAEYLSVNREHLSTQSYLEVLKSLPTRRGGRDEEPSPGEEEEEENDDDDDRDAPEDEAALRELDEKITKAMANMDYPEQWRTPEKSLSEVSELHPKETLLHLAVRLDLLHLAQFLIHQPRGQRALTLPNQDGNTPLQLAQKCREHAMFRALATPPVPAACPVVCVWSDSSTVLRFCPGTDSLILTTQHVSGGPEDTVMVLRDKMGDHSVLKQITMLRGDMLVDDSDKEEEDQDSETDIGQELLGLGGRALMDNVFEEQLVLSLDDDDDEEFLSSIPVKGHPVQSRGVRNQQMDFPGVPLVSAICSSTRANTQLNQVVDADGTSVPQYLVSGVTSDSTGTDGRVTVGPEDTPPPRYPSSAANFPLPSPPLSISVSPVLSPADRALARLGRPAVSDLADPRASPPLETCALSPSLVALEVDSEEDCVVPKSPFSNLSSDSQSSGDKMDAFVPSPDLTCTRSKSSSACDHTTAKFILKELGDPGIRLRSYSYSSPKMSLRPPRFSRDSPMADLSPDGVPQNVSYSRSLLQALSLSKSLSLLHPGKQRASSLTEHSHEKREIRFRKRAQSADDEGSMELAESLQHLTLSEFLKEIEEEEFDKCSIPSKVESEKYKVIRTFSFLKSRMSSTRNKNKGKGKDREAKDRLNGHRFATGPCMGFTVCLVCDKPASGKELLHCSSCTVMVHKACKESVPPCLKKLQEKYAVSKIKTASLPQNFTVRDSPSQCTSASSASLPVVPSKERKDTTPISSPLSGGFHCASDRLSEGSETESDSWRVLSQSEEAQQNVASSTSTESSLGDDCVDTCLHGDLTADADFEAESWSLAVEHKFCKSQDKRVVKRQDVIYELMQTEIHHLQTLHIMAEVFRRGMREEVQLDSEALERVFPCLDQLLLFHHNFFSTMRERQQSSVQPQGQRNYVIQTIGDILLQQFSDENADRMKQIYGEFCSHHNEAVGYFKELQQHNKRFQTFIKQQSNNSLVRRKEIPECILLVTQRITKYPVLLERILQYTQEDTQEHADLLKALLQIREVIVAVDARVSEYERCQRLQDVWSRVENRSSAKLKNGHTFRKQDMMWPGQTLKHQGLVLWKTATGRLKDVLALLLTDTIIFLQEKDQKYIFATVDQKPPVISLQKLIVREVANEERGMFLISASAAGPEMYEVHTSSKDERNTWMRLIREAVESCPEEEEEYISESEEDKRAAEARLQKIQKFQESLMSQDQQICASLEEKLQIYAELSALGRGAECPQPGPRLLVQPPPEEPPQAAVLLAAALHEAASLRAVLSSVRAGSPSSPGRDCGADSALPVEPFTPPEPSSDCELLPGESNGTDGGWADALALKSLSRHQKGDSADTNLKVAQSVQSLTQLLYSLQAGVIIQDSCCEVQRLLLSESERPSPRGRREHHPPPLRGHTLQVQEKQRNLEKRREEVAAAQRLQSRLRQEIQRWEKECQARQSQQGEAESRLEERERQCLLEAERLRQEREQLAEQLEEYQQSLERLREGQRSVEKERERLETQQKLLQSWKHSRQRGLATVVPAMVILDGQQVSAAGRAGGGHGSVFLNEATFASAGFNHRHKGNDPSAHNCLNALLARSNHRQSPGPKAPLPPRPDLQDWPVGAEFLYGPIAGGLEPEPTPGDPRSHGCTREAPSPGATGADQHLGPPRASDQRLDLNMPASLETENGEEGREENIVYL